jgi:hypothetical protein
MRNPDSFKEQRGFLSIAQNNETTDYLTLAYCQALSIKCTQKEVTSYAIIVDAETNKLITDKHKEVFDYIIVLPEDDAWESQLKFQNEWKVWELTPFKETIKLESDILFPTSIDHWWPGLQQREVCMTAHILNYEGDVTHNHTYRRLFIDNYLPDVYNGLMYFRFGRTSLQFFMYAKYIFQHWEEFSAQALQNCRDEIPSTDVVYAIAAKMLGVEHCTNPVLSYPTFVHMKGAINGWGTNTDWTDKLYAEIDDKLNITIGFTKQMSPIHYYQKHFITSEIIEKYERHLSQLRSSLLSNTSILPS